MKHRTFWTRWTAPLTIAAMAFGLAAAPVSAAPKPHQRKSFAQRHPNLTSAAAGIAAYKVAKGTGKARAAHGQRKNFAQRHPVITGAAAAMATHHVIKKSTKRAR